MRGSQETWAARRGEKPSDAERPCGALVARHGVWGAHMQGFGGNPHFVQRGLSNFHDLLGLAVSFGGADWYKLVLWFGPELHMGREPSSSPA